MNHKLQFREKRYTKKMKLWTWILIGVFSASFLFFYFFLNRETSGDVVKISEATLPTITMEAYDTQVNELHGYVMEMEANYMRDAIMPLGEDRQLPLTIHCDGAKVTALSYEIRSLDTKREIATEEVEIEEGDEIPITLSIGNLVEAGQEYLLILNLTSDGRPVYYYCRILLPQDCYEKECLNFVKYFHNTAASDNYADLATYVETSPYATDDFHYVTIESTIGQIGWEGFDGREVASPMITWTDINSNYNVIEMTYQMQRQENGKTVYYNVSEYYRVRYTDTRTYLLDFHRQMDQVLDGEITLQDQKLNLGITGSDLEYLSNETGTIVAFVSAGELYEYNQDTDKLVNVFSFQNGQVNDARAYYNQHNIILLNIDESGTLDFVIYGYMNRGEHEGTCGLQLLHYDSVTMDTTEEAFITTTNSYQILNADFSKQLYKSSENEFYIMINNTLEKVDLNTLETTEVLSNLSDDQYAASSSGRYFAYTDTDNLEKTIHVWDLENDEMKDIQAANGSYLIPLAFMDEDFVYGEIAEDDIGTDAAGTAVYPISTIYIIDPAEEGTDSYLKTYHERGYYVTSVTREDYTLYLDRVSKQDGYYVAAEEDTIKNTFGQANKSVTVATEEDDTLGALTTITMAGSSDENRTSFTYGAAGYVSANLQKNVVVEPNGSDSYFVYVGSQVVMTTRDVVKAIGEADEEMGIVIDDNQNYIWKRGKSAYKNTITGLKIGDSESGSTNSAKALSAMMNHAGVNVEVQALIDSGETPVSVLQRAMKNFTILDLTGCSLTEALYYVNLGNPVYAGVGDGDAVLLVGYDAANVVVYYPARGTVSKMGLMDAAALFGEYGNVFISYLENPD